MIRTNVLALAPLAAELSLRGQEVSYSSDVATFLDTPEYQLELSAWTTYLQAEANEAQDMCPGLSVQREYNYLLTLMPSAR